MHITITGDLGSGKSTICQLLKESHGYDIYSTGAVQREIAREKNMTTLEFNEYAMNNPEIDHLIDQKVVEIAKERSEDNLIFDSRMAWKFVPHSFRIYLSVDPKVAAERVFAVDRGEVEAYGTLEEAEEKLKERRRLEVVRFQRIYGVICNDPGHFDLVIDTTEAKPEEILREIISAIEN